MQAARLWWLLRHHGHDDVRVLDGGFAAWRTAGHPVQEGEPETAAAEGDFTALAPGRFPVVDHDGAAALAERGVLLDARAAERYRGEVEPVDPVAGHVPGALSAPDDREPRPGQQVPEGERAARALRDPRGWTRGRSRRPTRSSSARTAAPA